MSKAKIFLTIGVWVAVLPYLGFPYGFRNILFSLTGLFIVYLSYSMYLENKKKEGKKMFDNFSENHDFVPENSDFKKVD